MRVKRSNWQHACCVALLLFPAFVLSGEVVGGEFLPFGSELAGFQCDEDPMPSSVCGGISCDGTSCSDPSHQCFGSGRCGSRFKLTEFNIYPTFSYLDDKAASYNEFEFASITDLGWLEMENRTVMNVTDLPSTIKLGPTNPDGGSTTANVRASGFGDVLSGFFFSPRGSHEQNTHLGLGTVLTFPTATNDLLGSTQYTAGPGAHFSTEKGRLTAGFFLWQSWGFGGDSSSKRVNQLFGKPFILYELNQKWDVVFIPLGMSHSWDAPKGDDWTVPLGGGLRREFDCGSRKLALTTQMFDYVARKSKDPEYELRFTIEYLLD